MMIEEEIIQHIDRIAGGPQKKFDPVFEGRILDARNLIMYIVKLPSKASAIIDQTVRLCQLVMETCNQLGKNNPEYSVDYNDISMLIQKYRDSLSQEISIP